MNALTRMSAESWARAHGYTLDSRGLPAIRQSKGPGAFAIPADAGQRVAMVKGHMRVFGQEEEVCIWIDDWDVWPSGQWAHLFDRFRLSYGITSPLEDAPALLIPKLEFDAAVSAVVYAVLMLWDCYVLSASGRYFAFYSHDEVGCKSAEQGAPDQRP